MHASNRPQNRLIAAAMAALLLVACTSAAGSPQPSASSRGAPSPSSLAPSASLTPSVGPLQGISLDPVVSGLSSPIGITNAGDGSGRLFVNERGGRIRVINPDLTLRAADFVDLSDRLVAGGEQGLLGLAFHPQFETNRRLFVYYSHAGDSVMTVSELTGSSDGQSADPASERVLLTVSDQFVNHNGGQLAFGPDGYLYIGFGDGGGGGDPLGSGQSLQTLLGKILRIDVNGPHAAGKEYAIPPSNPFASGDGLPEIWAYGLRNPWRFSFDRATGDLYIGDVGQNAWEEIDRQPADSRGGENYGWNAYEASHCFSSCEGVSAVGPIAEYGHDQGCSVTGGYLYRGTRQPAMRGTYLFGDYCSGIIFTLPTDGLTATHLADTGLQISSFGEGEDDEIYLADLSAGGVYRVLAGG